jgi:ribose transport system permease protein
LGYFLADLRIPPFIATLGTLGLARGYVLYITGGMPVVRLPSVFASLGQGNLLGLPLPAVILLLVAIVIHLLLTRTPFGRHVYAIGSNTEAARLSGVEVEQVSAWTYVICGMTAGLAGMIMMARLATGQPTEGQGYELDGIAAVVIGGGSLAGGVGSVAGSVAGALVMALLRNGGAHLNLNDFIQQMIIGGVIILAVGFDEFRRRQALKAG